MGQFDHLKGHDPVGEEEATKAKPEPETQEPEKKSEERPDSRRPSK